MASTHPCEQFIPGFTPEQVLEEGKFVRHLPESDGFQLSVESDVFALGVIATVSMTVVGKDYEIPGSVTTFDEENGAIQIKGQEEGVGRAKVWINLQEAWEEEQGGTIVLSGVKFGLSGLKKGAELLVARHLNHHLPPYSKEYTDSVAKGLKSNTTRRNRSLAKTA